MDGIELLVDLHKDGERQGPGSPEDTRRALDLACLALDQDRGDSADHENHVATGGSTEPLAVADIGCGTGASTLVLAQELNARITAIDLFPQLLEILRKRTAAANLEEQIVTLACSMDELPFSNRSLDLIWSEGAIYIMGFSRGVEAWRRFLRPGGVLVVSEITWLVPNPPDEIKKFWDTEYPEIGTAAAKMSVLERAGYTVVGYFALPSSSWIDHFYEPVERRIESFLARHGNDETAQEVVAEHRHEAELYRRYRDCYSYGMYVARA